MVMQQSLLDKLQRKLGRYTILNLMLYIVAGMAFVFIVDMVVYPVTGFSASAYFAFDRTLIMRGQIWRLISFIFIPPNDNALFLFLTLYFYWLIGNGLQLQWGSFRFNLYYLCGIIGCILAGLMTGYTSNTFLNMSLFLAFALIYPDFTLQTIFLPVKVKWLALIDALIMLQMFVTATGPERVAQLISLANLALFFWHDGYLTIKAAYRRYQWKKNWRS